MKSDFELKDSHFEFFACATIVLFSIFPLFFSLPFRIHLDLPYEGAYRMYIGQMPFKDFGMPFGYAFFLIPTMFFHIFGPSLTSLLYAQGFLNIVSGFALLSIFKSLKVSKPILFYSIFIYCLSYIFIYFWPWHTHTAYTFGLVALAFILKIESDSSRIKTILFSVLAGLFSFLSMFTKQDYGGLNLMFCLVILAVQIYYNRNVWSIVSFAVSYVFFAFAFIFPLLKYGFGYWFNHGQPPHASRLELIDFLNAFFAGSTWEKFYLLAFALVLFTYRTTVRKYIDDKNKALLLLISTGMIFEALITKVTSRMSTDITTYYHSFGVAFLLGHYYTQINLKRLIIFFPILLLTILWWSPMYWDYAGRIFKLGESHIPHTYKEAKPRENWEQSELKSFGNIKLPKATTDGIRRLKQMPTFNGPSIKVMNMTELTSLPIELGYVPLKGIPLWYDVGVAIFPKQVKEICINVDQSQYDVFLFEKIPSLEDYFPEEVRISLQKNYVLVDTFLAPRKEGDSTIEVYIKK